MATRSPQTLTQLLAVVSRGDASAQEKLWSLIYDELHGLAQRQLAREPPGRTMQATSLVHEAYIRLGGQETVHWANRRHFFAAAAQAMRRIRIDEARHRHRLKRGGGRRRRVPLEEAPPVFDDDPAEILSLDGALDRLERVNKRAAEVVLLRYYGGLTTQETAKAMAVSPRTVESDWSFARAWLHRELKKDDSSVGRTRNDDDH